MTAPRTQAARRTLIAQVLEREPIHSQEELRAALSDHGIEVTQATLSRDLVDLGATKVPNGDGRSVYALPQDPSSDRSERTGGSAQPTLTGRAADSASSSRLARALHELAVSVDHSLNIVVVRTPPGGAQYLASAFDGAHWGAILGTVAGDDTVLIVTRGVEAGADVADAVLAMAEGRVGGMQR
jgi:transcriptional regulator of arginine metabolism